jgi:multiple sugar transport system substrate-binding protein
LDPGSKVGRVTSVVALLAAGLALSSCTGGEEAAEGTELSFFVFNEPSGAFQAAADKCSEESNGEYAITFEFLPADADGQREQLVRRLGAEDPSIDILGMDVIWTAEFANAGWIQPWEGELESQVTENVFDSVVDGASFEDTLYAAPFTSNTQLLWYRKDRVEQVPETWDQMLEEAERIGENGLIQVQADQYEGFVVWVNSMIESAGSQVLEDPETVGLDQEATEKAIETMARFASSDAAAPDIDTSTEDTARLSFEAGGASFMLNYPFVFPSAKENAPDVFEQLEATTYPAVVEGEPSRPPLGGINLGVSEFSENSELAFEAAACMVGPENQLEAAKLGGLPPTREDLYEDKAIEEAYPGFSDIIKESIDASAPRPLTPAYTDLSLALQTALHPIGDVDPDDVEATYEQLQDLVDQAVKREGVL